MSVLYARANSAKVDSTKNVYLQAFFCSKNCKAVGLNGFIIESLAHHPFSMGSSVGGVMKNMMQ
jgi:hypothetical protein